MPDIDWLEKAEAQLAVFRALTVAEGDGANAKGAAWAELYGAKLIAAVRLADRKAYEALQHVVVGQHAIAMDQLDELVACLRSGKVEDA